jgi:hypothetical protein
MHIGKGNSIADIRLTLFKHRWNYGRNYRIHSRKTGDLSGNRHRRYCLYYHLYRYGNAHDPGGRALLRRNGT